MRLTSPLFIAAAITLIAVIIHAELIPAMRGRSSGRQLLQAAPNGSVSNITIPQPALTVASRVLVITLSGDPASDVPIQLARQSLDGMNIPYEEYILSPNINPNVTAQRPNARTGPIENVLYGASINDGRFQAIIITRYLFVTSVPDVMQKVTDYARKFHARIVYLVSTQSLSAGTFNDMTVPRDGSPTTIRVDPAAVNNAVFSGLNVNFSLALNGVPRYPVIISDPNRATPLLRFVGAGQSPQEGIAATIIDYKDGLQEMHFYFEQAYWMVPSSVLSQVWVQWSTRGIYAGARRIALSPIIDDMFLTTLLFDGRLNGPNPANAFRITAADFEHALNTTDFVNQWLGGNSSIKLGFSFNGLGAGQIVGIQSDALFQSALRNIERAWWESHGFAHLNLTSINGRPTTYEEAMAEVLQNDVFARTTMFTNATLRNYMPNAIVTPGIQGLTNPEAIRAMADRGIVYVMGDNSIAAYRSTVNDYLCARTTAQTNSTRALLITPRFATSAPFDTSLPLEMEDENRLRLNRNSPMDTLIANDAAFATQQLLNFRADAYMFHQANLRTFNYRDPVTAQNGTWSIITLWARAVAANLRQYTTLPVISYRHTEIGDLCLAREARTACRAEVRLYLDATYNVVAFDVQAANGTVGCEVPVTGATLPTGFTNPNVRSEVYGPDVTAWVRASNTTLAIPLAAPIRYE